MWLLTPASPNAGGQEGRRGLAVRPEGLAVEVELGVVPARPPRLHGFPDVGFGDLEHLDEGREVGRRRHDRSDIEVAVGPAIETVADPRRVGVVDGRVTHRALDPHRGQGFSVLGEEARHADHGIGLQQHQRACRIGQVDLAPAQRLGDVRGDRVDVDLQAQLQRLLRTDARTDPAVRLARDRLMELQPAAPEILAAERVEAEGLAALLEGSGLRQRRGRFVVGIAVGLRGGRYRGRPEQRNGDARDDLGAQHWRPSRRCCSPGGLPMRDGSTAVSPIPAGGQPIDIRWSGPPKGSRLHAAWQYAGK